MLINQVFMRNPFANPTIVSNNKIAKLPVAYITQMCVLWNPLLHNKTIQCNKKGLIIFVCKQSSGSQNTFYWLPLSSKPLSIMWIPNNFNKHVTVN